MNHPAMNAAGALGQGIVNASNQASILKTAMYDRAEQMRATVTKNTTVFSGKIEVVKVANGYIVNIGRTEGYEYESHIATTPEQVNGIIMSQMVAFRLEDA